MATEQGAPNHYERKGQTSVRVIGCSFAHANTHLHSKQYTNSQNTQVYLSLPFKTPLTKDKPIQNDSFRNVLYVATRTKALIV